MKWSIVRDLGSILLVWTFLILAELAVVGDTYRTAFADLQEIVLARHLVQPIALAMLAPAALVTLGLAHLAASAGDPEKRAARFALSGLAAAAGLALGLGLTGGRHFTSIAARAPFVLVFAAVAAAIAFAGAPLARRALLGRHARIVAGVAGAGGALACWTADARVLPRLYPALHDALFALLLLSSALLVLVWRTPPPAKLPPNELAAGVAGIVAAAGAAIWSPTAASRLSGEDNLRLVLAEHAPIHGRAVRAAAWLAGPPRAESTTAAAGSTPAPGSSASTAAAARSRPGTAAGSVLDWSNADILLVSIDALRADHLGAYGYPRPTTPQLDALARESVLFEHAYCPAPSTSYSVTSMMTGKPMRSLLALGLANGSETWAGVMRRAGYKTAAFYPPAVFFIDEDRFTELERAGLGFEFRSATSESAEDRVAEVERYVGAAGPEPLFLWAHLYDTHEPYREHAGFAFADPSSPPGRASHDKRAIDLYDSGIAYTDAAVGRMVRSMRAARRNRPLVFIVTADHGEEFDDHGGRYHGTTCYEEQVRVPLLISGPGVEPRRVPTVVQTLDLMPTVLAAAGLDRPTGVKGRDLGDLLAGRAAPDSGMAYAETEDTTLLARGAGRLICDRKLGACALYDLTDDPTEQSDVARREPEVARELRGLLGAALRDLGKDEAASRALPEALRRGLHGEADAAGDVAALLDDPSVEVRRKAAEVMFRLSVPVGLPEVRRAAEHDADDEVRRWCTLALVRVGDSVPAAADALMRDPDPSWRRVAALAFAMRGDARGGDELVAWWKEDGPSRVRGVHIRTHDAEELLRALGKIHAKDAVPALSASLGYYPMRPYVADALGAIGDPAAVPALLDLLAKERYEPARLPEAKALVALGAARDALAPLTRLAGLADPMADAIVVVEEAKLLDAGSSGMSGMVFSPPVADVDTRLSVPKGATSVRLWMLGAEPGDPVSGTIDERALGLVTTVGATHRVEIAETAGKPTLHVRLHTLKGVRALWVVAWPTRFD